MKVAKRRCVDCGAPLGRQLLWHLVGVNKYGYRGRCWGPRKTPGGSPRYMRKPIHLRMYAGPGKPVCGVQGGWTKGKYKDPNAEVPWSRISVKVDRTTCEECLALLLVDVENRLHARLAATGGTMDAALERARTRHTMNGVRELVNA